MQKVPAIPGLEVPVLYLSEQPDGTKETMVPLAGLIDYFVAHSASSATWMLTCARGVGKFYDYVRQRRDYLRGVASDELVNVHRVAMTQFQNHLARGTVTITDGNVQDETGLFWFPHSSTDNSLSLMRGIDGFLKWLHNDGYGDRIGPWEKPGEFGLHGREAVKFAYVARYKHQIDFLAHIDRHRRQRQPASREIVGPATRGFDAPDSHKFPRQYLDCLFEKGFVTSQRASRGVAAEDLTAKLVAMLSAYGSLRRSEPLHLWVSDVQRVEGVPTVFLHHPVAAMVDHPSGRMTRQRFLNDLCGMQPRNLQSGKFHSGWKGIKCNRDQWTVLYWLPLAGVEERFWATFQTYVSEVRPPLMERRARRGLPDHPFLLVSAGGANRDGDEDSAGDPYTLAASGNGWRRAMARLRKIYGDPKLDIAKTLGTTQHGLRHLYGAILSELGLSPKTIQECMHHISPLSQQTYTNPRNEFVNAQLKAAAATVGDSFFGDIPKALRSRDAEQPD